jgi:hypothetical protein
MAGSCKRGNEHSCYIKCGEFLDYLRTGYILEKGSDRCCMYRCVFIASA